jgi:hypothetical protein
MTHAPHLVRLAPEPARLTACRNFSHRRPETVDADSAYADVHTDLYVGGILASFYIA